MKKPVLLAALLLTLTAACGGGTDPEAESDFLQDVEFDLLNYTEQDVYDRVNGDPHPTFSDAENREFIAAGYEMCDLPASSDLEKVTAHRVVLVKHDLNDYLDKWAFVMKAAEKHLC